MFDQYEEYSSDKLNILDIRSVGKSDQSLQDASGDRLRITQFTCLRTMLTYYRHIAARVIYSLCHT